MAAAVRGSSVVGGSGVTSLATSSFTSATGDTIAVWFNYGVSTDPTSVTDNKGNTYTQRGKVSRAGGFTAFLYTCENATGGAGTVVTLNIGFTEYPTLAAVAISGVVTSSVLDVLTTDGVDTAQPWTLSSGTLSQADEIVFGFLGSDSGSSTSTFTEGSGMTKLGEVTDSNLYWTGALAYVVVSATTARVQSWTSSVAGSNSTQIVASFKAASGGGGVTGTVSWTEANDTAALTGALRVSGAPSWTEANDTATVTGSVRVSGSASWTEANDTASLTGAVSVSGSVAWTEASDTTSITGALTVSGSAAWTEANDTAALTGTVGSAVSGSLSWTEADDAASVTGSLTVSGAVAWTESNDTAALSGTVGTPATGSLSWTEANDTAALSGSLSADGAVSWVEASDTASLAGSATVSGSASWVEANDTWSISAFLGSVSGTLAWTEEDDVYVITGPSSGGGGDDQKKKVRKRVNELNKKILQAEAQEITEVAVTKAKSTVKSAPAVQGFDEDEEEALMLLL